MVDDHVRVQCIYSEDERQFERALTALINNGCQPGTKDNTAEWRVRTDDRYHLEDQATVVEHIRAAGGGTVDVRARYLPFRLRVGIGNEFIPEGMPYLQLQISRSYFDSDSVSNWYSSPKFPEEDGPSAKDHLNWFLYLTTVVYRHTDPIYGYGSIPPIRGREEYIPDPSRVSAGEPEHTYWVNYLNAEMVEHVGRDTLTTAPVFRRERLPDDGEMFVVTEYPIEFGNEQSSQVADHLGLSII